jgi:chemotaxis protein CheD
VPSPSLSAFPHRVVVGLAELVVSNNPSAVLTTYSLGSCISVAIYDPVVRVGGLLHAMLPDSALDPVKARNQPGMFVDTGVSALLQAAGQLRAEKRRLRIYLAGGARILDDRNLFNIGDRNLAAFAGFLRRENLQLSAEHVGGQATRTVGLAIDTGCVTLKVSGITNEAVLC